MSNAGFTPNSGTTLYSRLNETTSDGDTTYIAGPSSSTASAMLGLGSTAGPVYAATIDYTARQAVSSGHAGTMNVHAELFDGTTLVGTGATHNLPTTYTAYSDTFAAVAVSSAANLRVKLVQETAGTSKVTSRFTYVDVVATYLPINDTTAPTAPTVVATASPSTGPAAAHVALDWSGATDNVGVVRYEVSRGGVRIGETTGSSYRDDAVVPGTLVSYTVVAVDAAYNRSAPSAAASVTTPTYTGTSTDTTAPSVPTGFTVSPTSPTSVTLSWSASTDNVGVDGYARIHR